MPARHGAHAPVEFKAWMTSTRLARSAHRFGLAFCIELQAAATMWHTFALSQSQ